MALTHFDTEGHAHMVDVSDKAVTDRIAVAEARVEMTSATLSLFDAGSGHALAVDRAARRAEREQNAHG